MKGRDPIYRVPPLAPFTQRRDPIDRVPRLPHSWGKGATPVSRLNRSIASIAPHVDIVNTSLLLWQTSSSTFWVHSNGLPERLDRSRKVCNEVCQSTTALTSFIARFPMV